MPPRFPPNSNITQRPLQSEIFALNRILSTDILEHSSRVLDHFATTSKLGMACTEPPPQLIEKLLEKCDDFDTVCDQLYYILEQSKTVLQLKYQQTNVTHANKKLEAERQQQQQQQQQEQQQQDVHKSGLETSLDDDLALGFNVNNNSEMMDVDDTTTTALDVEMIDQEGGTGEDTLNGKNDNKSNHTSTNHLDDRPHHVDDDDEWEELLQQQKDRLERMKKVVALGMDAGTVNAEGGKMSKDDLLF
ncbi:hypothetical protein BCR42DRAFT_419069 [Absidia repens]|uniref:Uncharacterized protein n=1 Tax=Absidia repens TaxID=90262 RepID=A0A1X2IAU4_9FUNG|nr:hypothetical protein BCR42DRAFT_419069 [Absidia repens]